MEKVKGKTGSNTNLSFNRSLSFNLGRDGDNTNEELVWFQVFLAWHVSMFSRRHREREREVMIMMI